MQELSREESEQIKVNQIDQAAPLAIAPETKKFLDSVFKYHSPKPGQPERYVRIREQAKVLAYVFAEICPESRERSVAFTKLQEAVMFANAAIAINE